jgi:hypothetical protein
MFKRLVLSLFLFSSPILLLSQSREMGVMLGVMGYKGDLNPTMYNPETFGPGIGFVYRRCYNNYWSFKGGINYGRIEANDADADDAFSLNRNLMFKSSILEFSGQFEFNFLPFQLANPNTKAAPYIMAGLSVFRFNPKGLLNDEWVALQPLGTEGQGTPEYGGKIYSRTSAAIVLGGGFKMKLSRRFGLTIESGVRRTYTDYLDDVSTVYADPVAIRKEYGRKAALLSDRSLDQAVDGNIGRQRGDDAKRDWYMYSGIQITYTLSKRYIDSCRPFRIKL